MESVDKSLVYPVSGQDWVETCARGNGLLFRLCSISDILRFENGGEPGLLQRGN